GKLLGEVEPVGEVGEDVAPRHAGDPLSRFLLHGDVRADTSKAEKCALAVPTGRRGYFPPAALPLDEHRHYEVRERLALLELLREQMQRGVKLAISPRRASQHLQHRAPFEIVAI